MARMPGACTRARPAARCLSRRGFSFLRLQGSLGPGSGTNVSRQGSQPPSSPDFWFSSASLLTRAAGWRLSWLHGDFV